MREIKFRVFWHKDKITTSVDTIEFLHGGIRVSDGCYHIGWQGKDCELREFTGLKDKNGKEIYEGDICFVEIYDNFGTISKDECFYAKVVWMNNGFHLVDVNGKTWTEWMTDYNDSLEVVDNIYDNPELLKEVET